MAFVLKKTGLNVFTGVTGQTFTIVLTVDKGVLTGPLARYDGAGRDTNPFSYPVAAAEKNLVIDYVGTDPNGTVTISEKDGTATKKLTTRPVIDGGAALRIVPAAAPAPLVAKKAAANTASAKRVKRVAKKAR